MTKRFKIYFTIFLAFILFSCHDKKFDSELWINDDPAFYPERKNMVNDIIDNKLLLNKDTASIFKMLGKSDWKDTTSTGKLLNISYTVQLSYGFDIDPLFSRILIIDFDTNNYRVLSLSIRDGDDRRSLIEKILTK